MWHRYYSPELIRFLTRDLKHGDLQRPSSLNLYSYCESNPTNIVDPTGNSIWDSVSNWWDSNQADIEAYGQMLETAGAYVAAASGAVAIGSLWEPEVAVYAVGVGMVASGLSATGSLARIAAADNWGVREEAAFNLGLSVLGMLTGGITRTAEFAIIKTTELGLKEATPILRTIVASHISVYAGGYTYVQNNRKR